MEMSEQKQDEVVILSIQGEIMGGDEAKGFQDRIYQFIQAEDTRVVVDMGDVKWMNSSGLGMLMSGLTTLRSSGGDLKLARVSDRVRRPIEVTKLDGVLKIYETVEEALTSYTSGG